MNVHAWVETCTRSSPDAQTARCVRSIQPAQKQVQLSSRLRARTDTATDNKRTASIGEGCTLAITPQFWANRYGSQITGALPSTVGTNAAESDYLVDFTLATGADVLDLACVFSFALGSGDWLKEWQPDWTSIPEQIVAWRTGMLSYGLPGWLHVPWLRFAYQSTTQVNLAITTDQGASVNLIIPSSGGVPAKFFTWIPAYDNSGKTMKFRLMEWTVTQGIAKNWQTMAVSVRVGTAGSENIAPI